MQFGIRQDLTLLASHVTPRREIRPVLATTHTPRALHVNSHINPPFAPAVQRNLRRRKEVCFPSLCKSRVLRAKTYASLGLARTRLPYSLLLGGTSPSSLTYEPSRYRGLLTSRPMHRQVPRELVCRIYRSAAGASMPLPAHEPPQPRILEGTRAPGLQSSRTCSTRR